MKFKIEIKRKINELKKELIKSKKEYLLVEYGKLKSQIDILNWVLKEE